MNIEDLITIDRILGIVGILLTIILSIVGFKISKKGKKNKLTYLKVNKVSLFSNIIKNFDNIEIKYENEKITDNLFYYSGKIFNDGDFDIDKNSVSKNFEIEFPKNFICREFKITKKSEELNVYVKNINSNIVQIEWDLLKKNEYFQFESLLEYRSNEDNEKFFDPSQELDKKIKHNFRITNLDKIDLDEVRQPTPVIGCGIFTILLFSAFLFFFSISLKKLIFPEYETYIKSTQLLNNNLVKIESENNNTLKLFNTDDELIKTIRVGESYKYLTNNIVIEKKEFGFWKILLSILAITYLIMAIYNVIIFYTDPNRKYQ